VQRLQVRCLDRGYEGYTDACRQSSGDEKKDGYSSIIFTDDNSEIRLDGCGHDANDQKACLHYKHFFLRDVK